MDDCDPRSSILDPRPYFSWSVTKKVHVPISPSPFPLPAVDVRPSYRIVSSRNWGCGAGLPSLIRASGSRTRVGRRSSGQLPVLGGWPLKGNSSQSYLKFGNEDEIGKTMSPAKAQRRQGSENSKNLLNFAPWHLGGINFPGVVLFNISKVSA